MKIFLFTLGLALCVFTSFEAKGFPTPIPKPKQTYAEASKLVMKEFAIRAAEYPARWRDEVFPQSVEFTNLYYSKILRDCVTDDDRKEIKDSKMSWILEEWGWVITVVMAHDLSQSETFFVRKSGEVVFLFETM